MVDNNMDSKVHEIALFLAKGYPEKLSILEIYNFMWRYYFADEVVRLYLSDAKAGRKLYNPDNDSIQNIETTDILNRIIEESYSSPPKT